MKLFSAEVWIAWLGATAISAASAVSFAYSVFETRDHARERAQEIIERLDRIERILLERK